MKIPMLSDKGGHIARRFGIYVEEQGCSLRGSFLIDGKGILRQSTVNDMPVGRSVDEALRLVQAFQFVEENGEVCPANWKPGKEGIKILQSAPKIN